MKKLLFILLLFFPFHGAWGESKILTCITDTGRIDFKLDLEKENFHPDPIPPSHGKNIILLEDEDAYVFSYDFSHDPDPEKNWFHRRMIIIDRYNGKYETWRTVHNLSTGKKTSGREKPSQVGKCELNIKKKF